VCWEDGGALRAVVGLSRGWERLHRRLPFAVPVEVNAGSGAGAGDHCGFLVAPELRDDVRAWLSRHRGLRPLLVRSACDGAALPSSARAVASIPCPRLDLEPGRDPVITSSNFRRQVVRCTRRLVAGGVEFEWVASGSVDATIVDALFDLHAQRRAAGGHETSLTEQHRALLMRLCASGRPGCGPAATVAYQGRDAIAIMFGFEWNGCFSAYQSGWDPAYAADSLGSVLAHESIRGAAAAGLRAFDFLRGSEPYKYRFGARDEVDATYLVPRGAVGRLLDVRYRSSDRRVRDLDRGAVSTRS
jgi:CelD/BcsL family acetyltransferase involved in cellulose biosynthesis